MKNSRPLLLSRPMVIAGLLISFSLAAGTAVFSSISTRNVVKAGDRVTATQATVLQINQLLSSVIDAETGQRGYILTGLESYLEPYTRATASFDSQLTSLRGRFSGSPDQLASLDRIASLVEAKTTEMARSVDLRRGNSIGPALHLVDSGAGLGIMNSLRKEVGEMEKRELAELTQYSASVGHRANAFQLAAMGMLAIAFCLAGIGIYLFMRRVNELESMITVCAWTRRVKYKGEWVSFEDYLHARFNLEFTHGISEEASKKLQMEAIELIQADPSLKFKARHLHTAPAPDTTVRRSAIKPV